MIGEVSGLTRGTVVNNVDPLKMGRVTVRIEGKIDESEWALPFGVGGGEWNIPAAGALVWVMFDGGDLDSPVWAHGPWTKPAAEALVPEDAAAAQSEDAATAHLLRTFESSKFKVTCDERPSPDDDPMNRKEFLRLVHKESGDMLEIDAVNRSLYIKTTASIVMKTLGMFKVDATMIVLNDRVLQHGSHVL
jgi:hypothetical protein